MQVKILSSDVKEIKKGLDSNENTDWIINTEIVIQIQ